MEKDSIKLISVNIELAKHLGLVRAFLEKEKPDIACLQEVCEADLKEFAKEFEMEAVFAQMSLIGKGEYTKPPFAPYGVGILSRLPIQSVQRPYYRGDEETAKQREFQGLSRDDPHPLLCASIKKGDQSFVVGTTHFTWTQNGEPDDLQRNDLVSLLRTLEKFPETVLVGDFNAPRGRETFDTLARYYKDNIPAHYATSIDANLHHDGEKVRNKLLMVDGLFTTLQYECANVRLQDGISDHMAIVAEIQRVL
ncbi:MAG: endonuclease/exonuclease/phosphatase family protein [Candidatus Wildermuthbacteria bacterium]|nr:endonuclease/exonuclease/phosphatase family protein [Candidatus Wildermuthbacteria bacterium]